jgi:hypothetical protein
MVNIAGTSFLVQRTFLAARRGHCKTARRQAATHLPDAETVACSRVTAGCLRRANCMLTGRS